MHLIQSWKKIFKCDFLNQRWNCEISIVTHPGINPSELRSGWRLDLLQYDDVNSCDNCGSCCYVYEDFTFQVFCSHLKLSSSRKHFRVSLRQINLKKQLSWFHWQTLSLYSMLIRHENDVFRISNRGNLKTLALSFSVDRKHFENAAFHRCRHVTSLVEFC